MAQKKQLQYLRKYLCHWAGDAKDTGRRLETEQGEKETGSVSVREAGRRRAAPHIKTYIRFADKDMTRIDWGMITSANLSTQAWGSAANDRGEIRICSWEIGVLVWPELFTDGGQGQPQEPGQEGNKPAVMVPVFKRDTVPEDALPSVKAGVQRPTSIVGFRMPYDLPLTPYGETDIPWSNSNVHTEPDWMGQTWGEDLKAGAPRPKWVMEEPPGYIPRGEDGPVMVNGREVKTAELLWSMPKDDEIPESFERGMSPEEEAKEEGPVKEEGKEKNADDDKKEEGDGEKELKGDKPHKETRVDKYVDEYMAKVRELAPTKSIQPYSTNYLDRALKLLKEENYDHDKALARLRTVNRYADLKEPHLRNDQIKAFEAGVAKYGSELRLVTKHVGTVPHKHIVRFYYMWKKTPRGKQIWGNFEGRRSGQARKQQLENGTSNAAAMSHGAGSPARLVDDIADDEDDSAFDTDKAEACRKGFTCKFCNTKKSREWRRAPWTPPGAVVQPAGGDKKDQAGAGGAQTNGNTVNSNGKRPNSTKAKDDRPLAIALCHRCAIMWRKYGVQWEEPDEVMRRIIAGGSKSWRRRSEEDHLAQLLLSSETDVKINNSTANAAQALGINVVPVAPEDVEAVEKKLAGEPSKKKTKTEKEAGQAAGAAVDGHVTTKKQKRDKQHSVAPAPPVPEPPLEPEPPRARTLPCAVCNKVEPRGDQYLSCKDCRMSVHKACYGQLTGHSADLPVTDPEHAPSLTSTSSK
ncbi:putative PHD type zinc finger protein with BAH domain-containing protein, partial [Ascosphaera atra]